MTVESITVKDGKYGKTLWWNYPYKRLNGKSVFLICRGEPKTESEWYLERRAEITNGSRRKELLDCRRALWGYFINVDDDPSIVLTSAVKPNTVGEDQYMRVCMAVMHEMPYLPEHPEKKGLAVPSAPK
jgi:hypothetical protein